MIKKIGFLCMLFVFAVVCSASALDLKPGKYEITTSMKMSGMPAGMPAGMAGAMPTMTMTQCMTAQDPVPAKTSADSGECRIINMKTTKNTVTYTMECDQGGNKVKSSGHMEYHGDSFEGSVDINTGAAAGGMKMTSVIKGKRIGSCD